MKLYRFCEQNKASKQEFNHSASFCTAVNMLLITEELLSNMCVDSPPFKPLSLVNNVSPPHLEIGHSYEARRHIKDTLKC